MIAEMKILVPIQETSSESIRYAADICRKVEELLKAEPGAHVVCNGVYLERGGK